MSIRGIVSPQAYAQAKSEQAKRFIARSVLNAPMPDPVDWIQSNFYIPETNSPIKLVPYQRAVIREALSTTDGLFNYSFILWGDIKKSAKSTIAGAISLYLAWHKSWETVRIVANDLKQADSRTFYYIERAIRLNPSFTDRCKINNYEINLPNQTTIHAIPVDPKGEAGGGDLITTFTEMWAMKNKASQTLWSETTLSPLKYGKSLRLAESYAGFTGESPILEPLFKAGIEGGTQLDLSFSDNEGYHDLVDLEVYRYGRTLMLWNTKPRCPWQTEEYYIQEASTLIPSEFARMHRNQWSASSESFIPAEWWTACKVDTLSPLNGRGVIIGLDAAVENDCFAIVVVSSSDEGKPQVRYCNIWTPPKDGQIDFSDVETELLRLFSVYNVTEVAYDPYQMASMAQRLSDNVFWKPFLQGTARLVADKLLYDMIRDRRIEHDGAYANLAQHIINADRKPEDDKLRIIKRNQAGKIDAVVALSMAVARATYYNM